MFRSVLTAAASILLATSFASAAFSYRYDDGQTDTSLGPPSSFPSNPQTGWGNYFVAESGSEWISSIQIAFGPTWPTRGPVTLYVMDDPDDNFNPGNAVSVASVTFTPAEIGLSIFNEVSITPTKVTGGFFILAVTNTVRGQDRMAAQDVSSGVRTDRSWLIYNPVEVGINVANLSANAYFQPAANATVIDGAFMIRATGVPEPTTLLGAASGMLLLGLRRR